MHIPDGYLSPATCATLYAAATPFWYISLRRTKRVLNTAELPLLSLFAAFCFVVMMFNLPLPGGTTGHATGVALAAIVVGPWKSILALSVALFIQAVFFGDGGITALGANCFNMAIVGSLTSYVVYKLVCGKSLSTSKRRVVAAAVAGYVAINVAAFLAAVEFGIQPLLFHDGTGAPLYAPYPLRIAVPAMMIGHLTVAGLAEGALSAGVIGFVQRTNPQLLAECSRSAVAQECSRRAGWNKHLWATLALLLILTPAGVLALGTAWGEWSAQDLADHEMRSQIAAASRNAPPPADVPSGLQRLSSIWTAPFPGYAPAFVRNRSFGYMLSGMFGAGLAIAAIIGCGRIASRRNRAS